MTSLTLSQSSSDKIGLSSECLDVLLSPAAFDHDTVCGRATLGGEPGEYLVISQLTGEDWVTLLLLLQEEQKNSWFLFVLK